MEVKINREIRDYTEAIFFGLSMRQFICSILACGMAAGNYFVLRPYFGIETLSWLCILGAAPFAALGFITYHSMTAEQFLWAWIRSELLEPRELRFEASPLYYEALKETIKKSRRKEGSDRRKLRRKARQAKAALSLSRNKEAGHE